MSIFEMGQEAASEFMHNLHLAADLEYEDETPSPWLGYAPPAPYFPPQGQPGSPDEELRLRYHTLPWVIEANEEQMSFHVNRNWIKEISWYHEDLVEIFQMFYDIAPLYFRGRLSPSVLNNLYKDVIIDKDSSSNIDVKHLNIFRGRHYASLYGDLQIGDKCDWARQQISQVRRLHPYFSYWTTAKQAESVARGFRFALLRIPEERHEALARLKDWIHIDTRSSAGHPKHWIGMPVIPTRGAKAKFVRLPGEEWTLQIQAGGVPSEFLRNLKPEHLDPRARPLTLDEIPWWCESPHLRAHFFDGKTY